MSNDGNDASCTSFLRREDPIAVHRTHAFGDLPDRLSWYRIAEGIVAHHNDLSGVSSGETHGLRSDFEQGERTRLDSHWRATRDAFSSRHDLSADGLQGFELASCGDFSDIVGETPGRL